MLWPNLAVLYNIGELLFNNTLSQIQQLWRRKSVSSFLQVECARITNQLICVLVKKLQKEILAKYEKCKGRAFSPDTGVGSLVTKVM